MDPASAARPRGAPPALLRLGKYELLQRIAVGGMAELFAARTVGQHGFEKIVALKRILASHADDEQFIRMLLAEARLAATLHHPNIAQVYDVGDVDGSYFFTMEYVFGQDLRQIVRAIQARKEWLTPDLILQIIIGTAAGLHYAHESEDGDGNPLGIVHRDVSPSNILVSFTGSVKLVDFGIARVSALQANTGLGALKGKVPYMSPEQCRGEPLDRRSDIFSLGIMLWELTMKRRLFTGDNDLVVAGKICNEDVPRPTTLIPGYPPALEAIVLKALARDRDQRYATAEELQLALEQYATDNKILLSSARLAAFMSDLFADLIKTTKASLREKIASSTGMFAVFGEEALAAASAARLRAAQSHTEGESTMADAAAIAGDNADSQMSLTRPEPSRLPRRRLLLGAGIGLAAALALTMIFTGGEPAAHAPPPTPAPTVVAAPVPPPTPTPTPTPAPAPVPVKVATPEPEVAMVPDEPAEATPTATSTPTGKKLTTKKRGGKTSKPTTKKSTNWDPDSPILPP
jgi:serine/threonine protein kinase